MPSADPSDPVVDPPVPKHPAQAHRSRFPDQIADRRCTFGRRNRRLEADLIGDLRETKGVVRVRHQHHRGNVELAELTGRRCHLLPGRRPIGDDQQCLLGHAFETQVLESSEPFRHPITRLIGTGGDDQRRSAVAAVGITYVGFNFVSVLVASGADQRAPVDAIVVLGAAQYDGDPSPVFQQRLDHAYALWSDGTAPLVVTTGSNQPGDRVTEGFAGFEYLRFKGVPEEALLIITDGASTWEQLAATARR